MNFSKLFFTLILGLGIMSCGDDDEIPMDTSCAQINLTSGIMVINEGPFSSGAGSLTVIDDAIGNYPNAYAANNCDSLAGSILQSATLIGDQIAVVANLSNLIRILDANTLEENGVIRGLKFPRYIVGGTGDLAYVSQWGLDGLSGSVVEVSLSDYSIIREVATGSGPEELQWHNDQLYVPHRGGFGADSTVVIIDPVNMSITKTLVTGPNPQSLAFQGDDLWVLNAGVFDFNDYTLNIPGSLVSISNDQITSSMELATGVTDLVMANSTQTLYWVDSGGISQHVIGSGSTSILFDGFFYDLAINPGQDKLYICDAKDFNSNGELIAIDLATGANPEISTVGLVPSEVIFY